MDDLKLYTSNKNQLDSLVKVVKIFSEDIGMEFGLNKCAILELKRGKVVKSEGLNLGEAGFIQEADPEGYKYLGILQLDQILENKMKKKIREEYLRRVKKICRSKLNGKNMVDGINSWAVGIMRYGAGIISWTKDDLKGIDRKTRKILSLNRGLHVRSNIARLYLPRKEGGRGLQGVEVSVNEENAALCQYINESSELMIMEASQEGVLKPLESLIDYRNRIKLERMIEWKEKPLHGKFFKGIEGFADDESWRWLRNGYLKRETEGMICAAQEQALRTNSIKHAIDKTVDSPLCRKCKRAPESVQHIVSGCTLLAQKEYKYRHDRVASRLHWELCKENHLEYSVNWYDHKPESVQENEKVKILWDMTMFTDRKLPHNRPDICVFHKEERKWKFIDIAVPFDINVPNTEQIKVDKYQDLAFEIERIHHCSVEVLPIVVGALGTVTSKLKVSLESLKMEKVLGSIQMAAVLGSANILRKILRL